MTVELTDGDLVEDDIGVVVADAQSVLDVVDDIEAQPDADRDFVVFAVADETLDRVSVHDVLADREPVRDMDPVGDPVRLCVVEDTPVARDAVVFDTEIDAVDEAKELVLALERTEELMLADELVLVLAEEL